MPTAAFTLEPRQLTVMTMSTCNARCAHCSVTASPQRDDTLDATAIIDAVERIHAVHPLRMVVFAGGEPTLLGEDLLDSIAHLDGLGIGTRIVTNGSWASTPEAAQAMVTSLREAGLTELNISADDFHLPFIPLANVVNAWQASKGKGFLSVAIALCSGPGSQLTPVVMMELLGERLQLLFGDDGYKQPLGEPAPDGTVYALSNANVYRIGRGRKLPEKFVRFPPDQDDLNLPCPWAIQSPAISPRNHLVACCGIEAEGNEVLDLGDLNRSSVKDMLGEANADPIVVAISELGPRRVMLRAAELDPTLVFRPRYSAICEICEDVTSNPKAVAALRRHAPVLMAEVALARAVRSVRAKDPSTPSLVVSAEGPNDGRQRA